MSNHPLEGLPPVARLMARLCEIPSPSRSEQQVAAFVRGELTALGMEITEDDAAEKKLLRRQAPLALGLASCRR